MEETPGETEYSLAFELEALDISDAPKDEYITMDPRTFLETYQVTDHDMDPLPIKVLRNSIIKEEIPGQAVQWGFEYLDQRSCPLTLITHLLEKVHHEVKKTDFSHCAEQSNSSLDDSNPLELGTKYEPLKLMRAVVSLIDEICIKEKEDFHDSVDGVIESPDMQPHVYAVSYNNIKNTRRFMEDRMTVLPRMDRIFKLHSPISYFAIFDGHNGSEAASYGAAQLHQYFIQSMNEKDDIISNINDAFESLDEVFVQKCKSGKMKSGSTVVLTLIMSDKLYVAWVGDSQAVLVKRDEVNNLVTPHKPERKDEIDRIRSVGGEVLPMNGTFRVNGNLAVSRAIGDAEDKLYIISTPDIKMLELDGTEEFLILACDGLWDEISPELAAHIVRQQVVADPGNISAISQKLISQAKQKGSTDNISVIVVFMEPIESIKNRYEGVLDGTEVTEESVVALKQESDSLGIKPVADLIDGNESPLGIEINGHSKDHSEPLMDYLSFGSSRESAPQLVSDDTGNHSGEDEMDKKDEIEVLSDADSDEDEWQFEKPSNQETTHLNVIGDGTVLTGAPFEHERPNENMQEVAEVVTIMNWQETDNSTESFNPFSSETLPTESLGQFDCPTQSQIDRVLNNIEAVEPPQQSNLNNTVAENEAEVPKKDENLEIEEKQEGFIDFSDSAMETIVGGSTEITTVADSGSSNALITELEQTVENYNPFAQGDSDYIVAENREAEFTESGNITVFHIAENTDLGIMNVESTQGNPFETEQSQDDKVSESLPEQLIEHQKHEIEFDPFAGISNEGNTQIDEYQLKPLEREEYFAQVETNPIPEGLIDDSDRMEKEDVAPAINNEVITSMNPFTDTNSSIPQHYEDKDFADLLERPLTTKKEETFKPECVDVAVKSENSNNLVADSPVPEFAPVQSESEAQDAEAIVKESLDDILEAAIPAASPTVDSTFEKEVFAEQKTKPIEEDLLPSKVDTKGGIQNNNLEAPDNEQVLMQIETNPIPEEGLIEGSDEAEKDDSNKDEVSSAIINDLMTEVTSVNPFADTAASASERSEKKELVNLMEEPLESKSPETVPEALVPVAVEAAVEPKQLMDTVKNMNEEQSGLVAPLEQDVRAPEVSDNVDVFSSVEATITEESKTVVNAIPSMEPIMAPRNIDLFSSESVAQISEDSSSVSLNESLQKINEAPSIIGSRKVDTMTDKKTKAEAKTAVTKTPKSPVRMDSTKPATTRAVPSAATRKSPAKPLPDSQSKGINGKASPGIAKTSQGAPVTQKPAARPAPKTGVPLSKPAVGRVALPSARQAPAKTMSSSEVKAPAKPPTAATTRTRPVTAPTSKPAPKAGSTSAALTSPKRPTVGAPGTSGRLPSGRPLTAVGDKPDTKSVPGPLTKPRPTRPTTATATTKPLGAADSKTDVKKPTAARPPASSSLATKATAKAPAPRPGTTSARTTVHSQLRTQIAAPRAATTRPPNTTTGSKAASGARTATGTATSRVPATTGARKMDPTLKSKKPVSGSLKDAPKKVPPKVSSSEIPPLIDRNGMTSKEVVNGNGETDELEKHDPVKENGVHADFNGGSVTEPTPIMEDLLN